MEKQSRICLYPTAAMVSKPHLTHQTLASPSVDSGLRGSQPIILLWPFCARFRNAATAYRYPGDTTGTQAVASISWADKLGWAGPNLLTPNKLGVTQGSATRRQPTGTGTLSAKRRRNRHSFHVASASKKEGEEAVQNNLGRGPAQLIGRLGIKAAAGPVPS
jgi:hypothetical protein